MADNNFVGLNGEDLDDDEALRIGLAMSLGQDPKSAFVDLTQSDSEDEVQNTSKCSPTAPSIQSTPRPPVPAPSSSNSFLGLNRQKMEEERLARLGKRKVRESDVDSLGSDPRPWQRQKMSSTTPGPSPQSSLGTISSQPSTASSQPSIASTGPEAFSERLKLKSSTPTSTFQPSGIPVFPKGVVKRTWVKGFSRQGDDIKIEEVLQKDNLKVALLSSFQWVEEWLVSKVDFETTKVVLIAYAKDEDQQEQMRANVAGRRIKYAFPPMNGAGAMHSKLMILSYGGYLRIAVPTGNLLSWDWGECGKIENMVFIIDLPLLQSEEQRKAQKLTPFAEDLKYFLEAQHVDELLLSSLWKYDFSETRTYGFVHTIAGSHTGEKWKRTGYCGLGRTVKALGHGSETPIEVDYLSSSIGNLNYDFIRALYYACQGDSGLKELMSRVPVNKGRRPVRADSDIDTVLSHMRVYFPSEDTVRKSLAGSDSAGTICLAEDWWRASSFPREIFRNLKSARDRILLHEKVIFVRRHGSPSFAYIGSANFSKSGWGRLSKGKTNGSPKLTCRNWECGVIIPVSMTPRSAGTAVETTDGPRTQDLAMFAGQIPIPMSLPAKPFVVDGSLPNGPDKPWFMRGH